MSGVFNFAVLVGIVWAMFMAMTSGTHPMGALVLAFVIAVPSALLSDLFGRQ